MKPGGVLFSSNPRGQGQEGWSGDRYGAFHDWEAWRGHVTAAGIVDVTADSRTIIQSGVGNAVSSEAGALKTIITILGLIGIKVPAPDPVALGMTVATNLVTTNVQALVGGSLADQVIVDSAGLIVEARRRENPADLRNFRTL